MADRPNTILVKSPKIPDVRTTSLRAAPGVVVVEMAPVNDRLGSLFLPSNVAGAERSDIGRVLASGVDGIEPNDVVGVRPYDGTERSEFQVGNEDAIPIVKFFGVYCGPGDDPVKFAIDESVLFKLEPDMNIRPIGKNILIEAESVAESTPGGIYLHEDHRSRPNVATVLAVGKDVVDVQAGDRIIYHPMAPQFDFEGEIPEHYGIMNEAGVEAIL
jgi:co-chaperonin GroES (HSP10)